MYLELIGKEVDGVIVRVKNSFCFIKVESLDSDGDVFAHSSTCNHPSSMKAGAKVKLTLGKGTDSDYAATTWEILDPLPDYGYTGKLELGKVDFFDPQRGFGKIKPNNLNEQINVFFHRNNFVQPNTVGTSVTLDSPTADEKLLSCAKAKVEDTVFYIAIQGPKGPRVQVWGFLTDYACCDPATNVRVYRHHISGVGSKQVFDTHLSVLFRTHPLPTELGQPEDEFTNSDGQHYTFEVQCEIFGDQFYTIPDPRLRIAETEKAKDLSLDLDPNVKRLKEYADLPEQELEEMEAEGTEALAELKQLKKEKGIEGLETPTPDFSLDDPTPVPASYRRKRWWEYPPISWIIWVTGND